MRVSAHAITIKILRLIRKLLAAPRECRHQRDGQGHGRRRSYITDHGLLLQPGMCRCFCSVFQALACSVGLLRASSWQRSACSRIGMCSAFQRLYLLTIGYVTARLEVKVLEPDLCTFISGFHLHFSCRLQKSTKSRPSRIRSKS